jgi:hypothetical protein
MKIRSGFVSNSSSSSFLAIIKKDDYEKILKDLGPLAQATIEYTGASNKKFAGQDCILHYHITGNYNSFEGANVENIRNRAQELAREQKVSLPAECTEEGYWEDFIWGNVYEVLSDFTDKVDELEKKGKAISHGDYF